MTLIEATGHEPAPRRLLLMRHAKSDWHAAGVPSDIARPLNARGRRDAPRMGAWLRTEQLVPDLVFCSPAVRTRQTLAAIDTELHLPQEAIHFEIALYLASLSGLCHVLSQMPEHARLPMLLGHNPGLEELRIFLTAGRDEPSVPVGMPTAAIACIEMPEDWRRLQPGCGRLRAWMAPKRLQA
jgi:phosphohistidine phosphatase